jgi:hypothetical protein
VLNNWVIVWYPFTGLPKNTKNCVIHPDDAIFDVVLERGLKRMTGTMTR